MDLKVYRPINKGCLIGAFTIVMPKWEGLELDGLFFEQNGKYWINLAPKEFVDKEGNKKSYNQARLPRNVQDKLAQAVKEKIKAQMPAPKKQIEQYDLFENDDVVPF